MHMRIIFISTQIHNLTKDPHISFPFIPPDVTVSRPEEQCIMTYVSQFLEHFPGMEEVRNTE